MKRIILLAVFMSLIRMPSFDAQGGGDYGAVPVVAYLDTSTGKIMNQVTYNGDFGTSTGMVETGKDSGLSPAALKMLGAGYQNTDLGGVYRDPTSGNYFIDPAYTNGKSAFTGMTGTADATGGIGIGGNDAYNKLVPQAINYRNSIYTGGDPMSDFLGSYGPLLVAGFGAGSILGAGTGAVAGGNSALQAIYGTGAGGFGAPAAGLLESVTPTISGLEAGAGTLGALTGTGGLTPLADAASLGAGTGGSPIVGADGVTSSISQLSNPVVPQVAGTTTVAPESFSNGFNINDPSTWPNISTPNGTGFTPTPDVPAPNLSAPTTDVFGNPLPGQTYNLGNSGTGMTPLADGAVNSTASGLPNIPTGAKSVLDKIMNGTATASDWAKLASSGIDIAAALASYNRQNQLWDSGADSRARFNQGMTNPSSVMSLFQPAVDQATDSYLRGISAKSGNPATLGSAPAETAKYVMGSTMLPAWNSYEGLNANVGWNAPSTNSANAAQNLASATGQAAGTLTNPNSDLTTTLTSLKNLGLLPTGSEAGSYIKSLFGNPV